MSFLLPSLEPSLIDAATPSTPLTYYPFYHTSRANLLDWISDKHLSLAAPVLVYWLYSALFALIDWLELPYFERRRLHTSDEESARNKVSVGEVLRAVVLQHVIQSALGAWWLESDEVIYTREVLRDHAGEMKSGVAPLVARAVMLVLGDTAGRSLLQSAGSEITQVVYWWVIPCAQFLLAMFVIDAWQVSFLSADVLWARLFPLTEHSAVPAVRRTPPDAREQIPVHAFPSSTPSSTGALRLWRALQPPC